MPKTNKTVEQALALNDPTGEIAGALLAKRLEERAAAASSKTDKSRKGKHI